MPASLRISHVSSVDDLDKQSIASEEFSSQDAITVAASSDSESNFYTDAMSPTVPVTSPAYEYALTSCFSVEITISRLSTSLRCVMETFDTIFNGERDGIHPVEEEQVQHCTLLRDALESNEMFSAQSILPDILGLKGLQSDQQVRCLPTTKWVAQKILSEELEQPEPDLTLGLRCEMRGVDYNHVFHSTREYFKQLQPGKDIITPLMTIEIKGPGGTVGQARLQNRHNAACMLSNLVALKRAAGLPSDSYCDQIQVLTIAADPNLLQISCHWIDGKGHYYSVVVAEARMIDLGRVRQIARNAIDWTKGELVRLEHELISSLEAQASETRKRKRSESEQDNQRRKCT